MNKSPYFSIVVPTYNRADLIGKTIQSILDQDFQDFEVLVVDDGSKDHTAAVISAFTDPRVQYHPRENAERGAARNYGRSKSRGQYINFFDSDDRMYSHHLSTAFNVIQNLNQPEFFHLGYDYTTPDWKVERNVEPLTDQNIQRVKFDNLLSCNGCFLRRDIAEAYPFEENRVLASSEDWQLWLRLMSRFKLHPVLEITSSVVNHDQRSLRTIKTQKIIARDLFLISSLESDTSVMKMYGSGFGRFKADRYSFFMLYLAEDKERSAVLRWAWRAIRAYPLVVFSKRFLAALKNTWL